MTTMAAALATIALLAILRAVLSARHTPTPRPRLAARVIGIAASATLLYFFLQPPSAPPRTTALKLLTANAGAADALAAPDEIVLALPEAPDFAEVPRVPDLGTALRRHPTATPLRVRGDGLEARDLDAARGHAIEYTPPPLPAGLVELSAPTRVPRGRRFTVQGRITAAPGGHIELLDPAGRVDDSVVPGDDGRFRLTTSAGPAGRVEYRLRARTAQDTTLQELALPLEVIPGEPLRVWVLAGGPSPELKYLRRWALDAGLRLHTQVAVGGNVDIGDPPRPFTAASLREFDLLVLDERAWRDLGERGRATLRDAVREGLGVLLRLTADPGPQERTVLRVWGFAVDAADLPRSLQLPGSERPDAAAAATTPDAAAVEAQATDTAPRLSRRPLRLAAHDGVPLLRDQRGDVLALWRGEGRGRIALWTLSDSFRLVLAGRRAAHGSLWAQALDTLARPSGERDVTLPEHVRAGERSVFCDLGDDARVLAPAGGTVALVRDPTSGCAAYWPVEAGWHALQTGAQSVAFPVRAANEGLALAAAARQDNTRALVAVAEVTPVTTLPPVPGPRWPWGLAWLLVSAMLWWLERRRHAASASTAAREPLGS